MIEGNNEFMFGVLTFSFLVLAGFIYYLLGQNHELKEQIKFTQENFHNFQIELKDKIAPALKEDFDNVYTEMRGSFISVWEYFYFMLATQGFLDVDPKDFFSRGLVDIIKKNPEFDYMKAPEGLDETQLYAYWQNHFDTIFKPIKEEKPKLSIIPTHYDIPESTT